MELNNNWDFSDDLPQIDSQNWLDYKDIYFKAWNQFEDDPKWAGTKKHCRMHDIVVPAALIDSMPQVNKELYMYEIEMTPVSDTFDNHNQNSGGFYDLLKSSRNYGILTAKQLPRMALMKFTQSFGEITCSIKYDPVQLRFNNPQLLHELKQFHYVLFRNVLNIWKEFFVCDSKDSVVVVPIKNHQIDWSVVKQFQNWPKCESKPVSERENVKYMKDDWLYHVVSPWYRLDSDENKYVVTHIPPDLTPSSQFPNRKYQNYADYTVKKYDNIRRIVNPFQFMLGVKQTTQNFNCINSSVKNTQNGNKEYLIPELCFNYRYPGDLWLKAIYLPSIFHRITYILHAENLRVTINEYVGLQITDYIPIPLIEKTTTVRGIDTVSFGSKIPTDLERHFNSVNEIDIDYIYETIHRSKDLNTNNNDPFFSSQLNASMPRIKILDIKLFTNITRGIEQHDLLAAITSIASFDTFHMEMFEILGDGFLKFAVSVFLMQNHSDWNEGQLTTLRSQIVGNQNLCYAAIRKNLPGMIKIQQFQPKCDWQPPMFKVMDHDKLTIDENSTMYNFLGKQRMSDKICADCVEAILGTCVKSIGVERTFKILEMLDILPRNGMDISRILLSPRNRSNISDYEVDNFLANHQKLETSIGYTFKDRAYLLQALTDPSYLTNRVTGCYQQLEFFGDAVLDFLITAYIFEHCPQMDPGQLTDLRSALVNNVTLASLCVRYNIHDHILSENVVLTELVNRFVDLQRKFNHEVGNHVIQLMEDQSTAEYIDVPKVLGDVFEAIIGGIFLDSGNDLQLTWSVIYRLMKKEMDKFMANVPIQLVRQLYEFPNANPVFDNPVVNQEQCTVLVNLWFTHKNKRILVYGRSTNKENAKRAAAQMALNKLKG